MPKQWIAVRLRRIAQRLYPIRPGGREFHGFWEPRHFEGDERLRIRTNGLSWDTEMFVGNQIVSNCSAFTVTVQAGDLVHVTAEFDDVPFEFDGPIHERGRVAGEPDRQA